MVSAVSFLTPEAAAEGPIAALIDGDMINVDLLEHRFDVALSQVEIEQRLSDVKSTKTPVKSLWLRRYTAVVTSANTGAVLADF